MQGGRQQHRLAPPVARQLCALVQDCNDVACAHMTQPDNHACMQICTGDALESPAQQQCSAAIADALSVGDNVSRKELNGRLNEIGGCEQGARGSSAKKV